MHSCCQLKAQILDLPAVQQQFHSLSLLRKSPIQRQVLISLSHQVGNYLWLITTFPLEAHYKNQHTSFADGLFVFAFVQNSRKSSLPGKQPCQPYRSLTNHPYIILAQLRRVGTLNLTNECTICSLIAFLNHSNHSIVPIPISFPSPGNLSCMFWCLSLSNLPFPIYICNYLMSGPILHTNMDKLFLLFTLCSS